MTMLRLITILLVCASLLYPVGPGYYGARSLALGYASTAYNFDVNAIFINPALLFSLKSSVSGYQYENGFMDYQDFLGDLQSILDYDLKNVESLSLPEKEGLFAGLNRVFQAKTGFYGFIGNIPGYVSRGYGVSFSVIKTAFINPKETTVLAKDPAQVTNGDIASLAMNFLAFDYKQVSLAYAFGLSNNMVLGANLHYLYGKVGDFDVSLTDNLVFSSQAGSRDYLEYGWGKAGESFSQVTADLGVSMNFGQYFNAGLMVRNVTGGKIKTATREIALNKRITAGLALTPDAQWGIYLDMDIVESELYFNGKKMQPLSLGVEKGFFRNMLCLRAGILADLTDKYFIGRKSNALYACGIGFNMRSIALDLAVAFDGHGGVDNLAVSGFFIF